MIFKFIIGTEPPGASSFECTHFSLCLSRSFFWCSYFFICSTVAAWLLVQFQFVRWPIYSKSQNIGPIQSIALFQFGVRARLRSFKYCNSHVIVSVALIFQRNVLCLLYYYERIRLWLKMSSRQWNKRQSFCFSFILVLPIPPAIWPMFLIFRVFSTISGSCY